MISKGRVDHKNLFEMKPVWTVPETARFLSNHSKNEISEADVFRLALQGKLKLSVEILKKTPAKPYKFTGTNWVGHTEEIEMDFPRLKKKIKSPEGVIDIWGICDLPMRGGEVLDVKYEMQKNYGPPVERIVQLNGTYVQAGDGQVYQLQESTGDMLFPWRPARCLPEDKRYLVLSGALIELIENSENPSEVEIEKDIGKNKNPKSAKQPINNKKESNLEIVDGCVDQLQPGKGEEKTPLTGQAIHENYLRLKQIIGDPKAGIPAIIPVSKSTWWAWVKSGRAPKPIKLSQRCTVWKTSDILAYKSKMENGFE